MAPRFGSLARGDLTRLVNMEFAVGPLGDVDGILHRDRRRTMHLLEHVADRLRPFLVRIDSGQEFQLLVAHPCTSALRRLARIYSRTCWPHPEATSVAPASPPCRS